MRSSVIAAAFAIGALAVPHQKRDMATYTDVDVVYVTDVVTVTGAAPTAASTPDTKHYGHKHGNHWTGNGWSNPQKAPADSPSPSPSSVVETPSTVSTRDQPAATSAPDSGSGSAPSGYNDLVVFHHNLHRANHSAPDIQWDDGLAKSAADIAATCIYAHNTQMDGGGYGQNIAAGVPPNNVSAVITDLFYNGEVNYYEGLYGQANPDMSHFENWGHFSQIVWAATTHVACATQDCTAQGLANTGSNVPPYFTVCNYKSPGNFGGEYGQNVKQPLGHATAQWNTGS